MGKIDYIIPAIAKTRTPNTYGTYRRLSSDMSAEATAALMGGIIHVFGG